MLAYFSQSANSLYNNISPKTDHWLSSATGISQCTYHLIFLQKAIRVDIEFARKDAVENKQLFDFFYARKQEIEAKFGHPLDWLRLDNKKSSRIEFSWPIEGHNQDLWQDYTAWHLEHIQKLEQAFKPYMKDAYQVIK